MSADDLPEEAKKTLDEVELLIRKLVEQPSRELCRALVAAADRLVNEVPDNHPHHGNVVIDFGISMTLVWKITHDEEAWKHGLNLILSWREQTAHDSRNSVYILAHGLMLSERAQTSSEASDINHAIAILEQAVESVRWDSFVAWKGSLPLASLLLIRYKQIEDVADLEAAGRYAWQKVSTGSATDPDRYYALKTFVQVLLEHYELKNEINDLEAAIVQATAAIKVAPGTYERGDVEMLLGSALRRLYQRSKSGEILKQAIKAHESALEHTNLKDPELVALRTGNLANAIADRYAQSKTRVDIDRAIELTQAALDQLPKQSPQKTRILRNLGLNLIELGRAQIDDHVLQSALTLLRDGLSLSRENKDEDEEILLLTIIANNLLNLDSLQGVHSRLDEAISTLEQAYEKSWVSNKIATEVTYRLAERDKTIQIVRLLTGALLRRAQLGGAQTNQDLTRAFVLGEASKSALFISEIMRRSLNAPSSIPQNMIEREGQLLARLAGLDNIHLRAYSTSLVRRRRQMEERADLVSALEDVWNEIEATGHEGRSYVNLRRLPHEAIIQLLSKARGATACVSLLETTFPNSAGQNQRRLAIMALWPSSSVPQLLSWLPNDPLSDINIQLAGQIQEYRVTDSAFESILTPLSIEIPEVLGGVTVSATRQGQNIPWHLVVQKAGWFSPENMPLPVILVPGLGTLLFDEDSGPHLPWHSIIDYEKHFALEELPDNFDKDTIQILGRMPINASTTPLVVGNPSWDLPDAESEATKVGNILNVQPLIGENATIAAVRNALSSASLIHLATHAVFHATSPLESQIKLFDGELSVGDLLGVWSTAKLIVLSACESGSGKPLAGGEISSLATVLLRAGVRSVVASLWPVDDAATAFLMTKFHAALQTNLDVPEALASAMHIVRNEPGWDDPFYWAGFVTFQRGMAD